MRTAGILLIVVGVVGLVWGGITYTRSRDTVNVGPLSATVEQKKTLPIPPLVSAIVLVAGVGMLLVGGRRRA